MRLQYTRGGALIPFRGWLLLEALCIPHPKNRFGEKKKAAPAPWKTCKIMAQVYNEKHSEKTKTIKFRRFWVKDKKKKKKNLQTKIAISTVRCTRRCIREKVGARSKPSSPVQSFFFFIYSLAPENSYWNESISSLSAGFRPPVHCTHLLPHPRSSNDDELPA